LVAANRGICSSGPYKFVRHPIYFGYVLLHTGFFMLNPSLWNLAIFGLLYSIKIPRILIEEGLLSRDPEYRSYMDKVRFRLLPGLF
jgi:protein-S-isoprenylcysteine O-methyltransferase Ste14